MSIFTLTAKGSGLLNDWHTRSRVYNNLKWATNKEFIRFFTSKCAIKPNHTVLDVGCGTGITSRALAELAKRVIAIDISWDMLNKAIANHNYPNLIYKHGDAQCLPFAANTFDLVTMRMSLHHIKDTSKAIAESHRVLKKGGKLVLCEGIPPDEEVRPRYEQIFALKEKRHTFSKDELIQSLHNAGFISIAMEHYIMPQVSLNNWLENSAIDEKTKKKIINLHLNADSHFKEVYRLTIGNNDIFMDWKFALVSGER